MFKSVFVSALEGTIKCQNLLLELELLLLGWSSDVSFWSLKQMKLLGAGDWFLQRCQCSVSRGTGWRIIWRMVSPSEKLWDGAVSCGATEKLYLDGRGMCFQVIHRWIDWIFQYFKSPETGILCEIGSFYLKICHGMSLTLAIFLSTDGRNM